MVRSLEQLTMRKVYLRILPFAALTYFFCYLDRINVGFAALTMNNDIGLDAAILGLDGMWGLKGWQLMYILEAIPTVLIGVAVFFYLTDRPEKAHWLSGEERGWLAHRIAGEQKRIEAQHNVGLLRSFWDPKVMLLSLNYIGIVTASLGMLLFLPTIVKELGVSNMQVGWVTMIPYICGAIAMVFCGWLSDRLGERRWILFWTCALSAVGLIIAGSTIGSWWSVVGMSIAATGLYGTKGPFWSMPTMFLTGAAAASGIAWINSLGNLGGFFGPSLVGWAKTLTGSFAGGLYALAACAVASAIISLFWLRIPRAVVAGEEYAVPAE